ncbi:CoaE-domain-containing protein [Trichodelitschia bisporula]|uniref:CoaE-domain-containing protein n=1 Tax=Trichodelitschia bisporula TaxID=703511 RepID=A0A6G1I562_9PEZI|nr:CoaE-domain-containing protein [Trichodelitschia bisporula]
MLLLGLTGSIATGKSTVSNLLRAPPYSLPIIDADVIARQVVEPGTSGYNAIVKYFGPSTPDLLLPASDPAGRPLNRPALGRRVFGEGEERGRDRKVLNGIVHPAVRREMWKLMFYYFVTGHRAVVLDIPLLFESGWERYVGTVAVVAVSDPAVQMQRLRERDPHLSEEDARNRVLSQGDVRDKARRALARGESGVVVWNDGDREALRGEVERVMREVYARSPLWWTWLCLLVPPVGVAAAGWALVRNKRLVGEWEERERREKAKL